MGGKCLVAKFYDIYYKEEQFLGGEANQSLEAPEINHELLIPV